MFLLFPEAFRFELVGHDDDLAPFNSYCARVRALTASTLLLFASTTTTITHNHSRHYHQSASASGGACNDKGDAAANGVYVEIKELPVRLNRRLDRGKGVDLGSDAAMWMERKDVPIDYGMSRLES